MIEAIRLAMENVEKGKGGPFAAIVVKEGKVIAACANTVTADCDPTAHAEVNVIRMACRELRSHQLSGCELYCSCEPCQRPVLTIPLSTKRLLCRNLTGRFLFCMKRRPVREKNSGCG